MRNLYKRLLGCFFVLVFAATLGSVSYAAVCPNCTYTRPGHSVHAVYGSKEALISRAKQIYPSWNGTSIERVRLGGTSNGMNKVPGNPSSYWNPIDDLPTGGVLINYKKMGIDSSNKYTKIEHKRIPAGLTVGAQDNPTKHYALNLHLQNSLSARTGFDWKGLSYADSTLTFKDYLDADAGFSLPSGVKIFCDWTDCDGMCFCRDQGPYISGQALWLPSGVCLDDHGTREHYYPVQFEVTETGYALGSIGLVTNQPGDIGTEGDPDEGEDYVQTDTANEYHLDTDKRKGGACVDTNAIGLTTFGGYDASGGLSTHGAYSRISVTIRPVKMAINYTKGLTTHSYDNVSKSVWYNQKHEVEGHFGTGTAWEYTLYTDVKSDGTKVSDPVEDSSDSGNLKRDRTSGGKDKWYGSGGIPDKNEGNTFRNTTTTSGGTVTLTAKWKTKTVTLPQLEDRGAYSFVGWFHNGSYTGNGSTQVTSLTFSPSATTDYSYKVYAKWKPKYDVLYTLKTPKNCSTRGSITGSGTALSYNATKTDVRTHKIGSFTQGSAQTFWNPDWQVPGYHWKDSLWHGKAHSKVNGSYPAKSASFGSAYNSDDWRLTGSGAPKTLSVSTEVAPNGYTISYDKNQPSNDFDFTVEGTVNNTTHTFDLTGNLSSSKYTCVGYEQVGWSTVPGDYETQMNSCTNVSGGTYTGAGCIHSSSLNFQMGHSVRNIGGWEWNSNACTVKLYAIWKPRAYKVVYTKGTVPTGTFTAGSSQVPYTETSGANVYAYTTADPWRTLTQTTGQTWGKTTEDSSTRWPVWSREFNLYNNTPQLTATAVANTAPHFTAFGYYIDYWTVAGITGSRETSRDTTGDKLLTLTGYTSADVTKAQQNQFLNLCAPTGNDCVVTLQAHWAPIRYKVRYNNDTTIPDERGVDRQYKFSTDTKTSDYKVYGKSYKLDRFNPTRSNKYGKSTFLGFCFVNGDTQKTPSYVVKGKSPSTYTSKVTLDTPPTSSERMLDYYRRWNFTEPKFKFTATDFNNPVANRLDNKSVFCSSYAGDTLSVNLRAHAAGDSTVKCEHPTVYAYDPNNASLYYTYQNTFEYIKNGANRVFNLYAVWDDCPGIEPIDTEQLKNYSNNDFNKITNGLGTVTRHNSDLEYKLLMLPENYNSIWDREGDEGFIKDVRSNPNALKNHYYIDNFDQYKRAMQQTDLGDHVATFEVRYTLVDMNGNKYQTSRKYYTGNWRDIMLHYNPGILDHK